MTFGVRLALFLFPIKGGLCPLLMIILILLGCLLRDKSEVASTLEQFYDLISTQFNIPIQVLCTDNGIEFFNSVLDFYLSCKGIIHQSSCMDTPQQNGVFERKNRHLLRFANHYYSLPIYRNVSGVMLC